MQHGSGHPRLQGRPLPTRQMFGSRSELVAVGDAAGPRADVASVDRGLGRPPPARSGVDLVVSPISERRRPTECECVRVELGEVAEGLTTLTLSARRHVRCCARCSLFENRLDANNRTLAAIFRAPAVETRAPSRLKSTTVSESPQLRNVSRLGGCDASATSDLGH